MKIKIKSMFAFMIFIGIFLILLNILQFSSPSELKLLKEVNIPFQYEEWDYAYHSGHLILGDEDHKRIILYDKSGNIKWQWGPDLKRYGYNPSISSDGRIFIFQTCKELWEDERIHYYRDRKEIWNKEIGGDPTLSPDGNLIAVIANMETGDEGITLYNSQGIKLWNKHRDIEWQNERIGFSYNNFILANKINLDTAFYIFDKEGNIVFSRKYAWGGISAGGKYIRLRRSLRSIKEQDIPENELPKEGLYDIEGNFLMKDYGIFSKDGTSMLISDGVKIKIVGFPSQNVLKEYPIDLEGLRMSGNERLIFGYKRGVFHIIDTKTDKISKYEIKGKMWHISYDGTSLLSKSSNENKIYFYKLNIGEIAHRDQHKTDQ